MSVLKDFKAFAFKGNVVDLAVAVVIGGAFGKIIGALVADIIMPLVGAVLPGNEWRSFTVSSLNIKAGDFLGAIVDFLIIAMVLFIVVVKFMAAFKKKEPESTKNCPECLEAIPAAARRCKACTSVVAAALMTVLLAGTARADDPKYEYKDPTAAPVVDLKKPTLWKANLALGLTYAAGNADSLGVTGTAMWGVKHYNNEFSMSGGGAYQRSGISAYTPAPAKGGPITDHAVSVENWLVKARYDRYFLEKNTVFVSFQSQGDRPAGYIYRLEPQVGYARLFFQSVHQLFRGEIGYDYTFEHRLKQPPGVDRDVQYHSGRLFFYYENKFTPYATFTEGLELLEAFNRLEGFRLNSLTTLSSQIWKNIAIKLNFKMVFNNDPAARPAPTGLPPFDVYPADNTHFDKLDTQLDVLMVVTIL